MHGPLITLPADARAREASPLKYYIHRSWGYSVPLEPCPSSINTVILGALRSYFECYEYDLESETNVSA